MVFRSLAGFSIYTLSHFFKNLAGSRSSVNRLGRVLNVLALLQNKLCVHLLEFKYFSLVSSLKAFLILKLQAFRGILVSISSSIELWKSCE